MYLVSISLDVLLGNRWPKKIIKLKQENKKQKLALKRGSENVFTALYHCISMYSLWWGFIVKFQLKIEEKKTAKNS